MLEKVKLDSKDLQRISNHINLDMRLHYSKEYLKELEGRKQLYKSTNKYINFILKEKKRIPVKKIIDNLLIPDISKEELNIPVNELNRLDYNTEVKLIYAIIYGIQLGKNIERNKKSQTKLKYQF